MADDPEQGRSGRGRAWRRRFAVAAGAMVIAGVGLFARPAGAAMLDQESCRRIKSEFDALGASGIREIMTKGPEWAKSNVTKERMEQIRRYLVLEEDVRFRCPLGKARPELEAAESEAGATTPLQPNEAVPGAARPAPAPAAKPARKAKSAAVVREADPAVTSPATQNGETTAGSQKAATTKAASAKARTTVPKTDSPASASAESSDTGTSQPARKTPR